MTLASRIIGTSHQGSYRAKLGLAVKQYTRKVTMKVITTELTYRQLGDIIAKLSDAHKDQKVTVVIDGSGKADGLLAISGVGFDEDVNQPYAFEVI